MQHHDFPHQPVLLDGKDERLFGILQPKSGESVLDVTLGLAGHAEAFLKMIGERGHMYGIEADERNLETSRKRLEPYGTNMTLIHGNFRRIAEMHFPSLDIIFADLGVSSPHLDDPERGFTFRVDAPLDLRFDQSYGESAAEIITSSTEEELKQIFQMYGELRGSGKLAYVLFREVRHGSDMCSTADLRDIVERLYGFRASAVLPQVFQALRIAVNDELGALKDFLKAAPGMLKTGGRLGVISYHSLEDRFVKQSFRALCTSVLDVMTGDVREPADFTLLTRKALIPGEEEVRKNPRARSAKFRAIKRLP